MNKATAQGFADELQKLGAPFMPVTRLKGVAKRFFARRKGSKDIIKQVNEEAAAMLKKDPNFKTGPFIKERTGQLQRQASETSAATHKNIIQTGEGIKPKGWVSKHKKGLILGGLGAGAAYMALSGGKNPEEERRRQLMAMRNTPQRVYY